MSDIKSLDRDSLTDYLADDELSFIDVWGSQCQPCMALAPVYEELADTYTGTAKFSKLDAPANRMACVGLKVAALPTFLAYRAGNEVGRLTGSVNADSLRDWTQDCVEKYGA